MLGLPSFPSQCSDPNRIYLLPGLSSAPEANDNAKSLKIYEGKCVPVGTSSAILKDTISNPFHLL